MVSISMTNVINYKKKHMALLSLWFIWRTVIKRNIMLHHVYYQGFSPLVLTTMLCISRLCKFNLVWRTCAMCKQHAIWTFSIIEDILSAIIYNCYSSQLKYSEIFIIFPNFTTCFTVVTVFTNIMNLPK